MKIEIVKTGWFKQNYTFRIKANNGEIIIPPERYNNLKDVEDTIHLLQKELPKALIVNIVKEKK